MKKRLIALMCTGIVGLTTLTGCSESFSKKVEIDEEFNTAFNIETVVEDAHIIVDDHECKTLHRGDIFTPVSIGNGSSGYMGFTIHKYNCGESLNSNYHFSFSEEKPSEDKYDQICDDCYNLGE